MTDRGKLVEELLQLKRPLSQILRDLRGFGWDSERVLANLSPHHMVTVLERYLSSELSAEQVEEWANSVEGREDIGFTEGASGDLVRDALHELANPVLTRSLSTKTAAEWINRLRRV